jgi:hypothetical protein
MPNQQKQMQMHQPLLLHTPKNEFYLGTSLNFQKSSYNANANGISQRSVILENMIATAKQAISTLEVREKVEIPSEILTITNTISDVEKETKRQEQILAGLYNLLELQTGADKDTTYKKIQETEKEIEKLEKDKKLYDEKILLLNGELALIPNQIAQLNEEIANNEKVKNRLNDVSNSASEYNFGGSFFAGYTKTNAKFTISGEMGFEIGKFEIGSNLKNEIAARGGTAFFANARLGYYLEKDIIGYVGFGVKKQSLTLQYVYNTFDFKSNSSVRYLTLLAGVEKRFNSEIGVFGELAYNTSMKGVRFDLTNQELDFKVMEVKVGMRYYVDEKRVMSLFR